MRFKGDNKLSAASGFKNLASNLLDVDRGDNIDCSFAALPATAADIRVEDVSEGRARVTLTLPWPSAIAVLDLLQRHGLRLPQNA